jgi:flagellar hook-associated protein 3 FlgL
MIPRVTSSILARTIETNLRHLRREQGRLLTAAGDGKRVRQPSDDPVATSRIFHLRAEETVLDVRRETVDRARTALSTANVALDQAGAIFQKAREIAIQAASVQHDPNGRQAMAEEIEQLLGELVDVANTQDGERFLFGGFATTTQPFVATGQPVTGVTYQGDQGERRVEVSPGHYVPSNVPGDQVFLGGPNLFDTLVRLRDNILAGDAAAISNTSLAEVSAAHDQVLNTQVRIGAGINRLESLITRLESQQVDQRAERSKLEDADIVQTTVALQSSELALEAAMSGAARVLQPSLLDYLA